ncbi:hypothetical protein MMC12_001233 [Toensbergia leucococca]|nr:hypothetical protein [Toensbergia leucococca]
MYLKLSNASLWLLATVTGLVLSKITSLTTLTALCWSYFLIIPGYFILYQSWIYPSYLSPLRAIPTPPGFPLWGQTHAIVTEEAGVPQRTWHRQYGPIVRYFLPFGIERLSVVDDEDLKQMTVKNPYNYPKPATARDWMVRVLGDGVLLAEGDVHVHQRKALAPAFSISSIKALSPVFWRKSLLLSSLWLQDMAHQNVQNKRIEVLEWLNRTTLDIIGEAGFGTEFDSLRHPEIPIRKAYRSLFSFDLSARLFHGLQSYSTLAKYLPFKLNREMDSSRSTIVTIATKIINFKLSKAHSKSKDVIALMVKDNGKAEEAGEEKLSFETMRGQVMTFLGAGHDTTATGVAWTLHLLSKHPQVQEKLRAEIRYHMPFLFNLTTREDPDHLAAADADQLHYLDNVCRESLRYIPPIPFTVRQLVANDTLSGYDIAAGSYVYIHSNVINRVPKYWGHTADVFDPDRWDNLPADWTTMAYMTFLHGPRSCIGRKFAETEMKTLLCSLLSLYSFECVPGIQDPETLKMWRLVLRPRDGITLNVRRLN